MQKLQVLEAHDSQKCSPDCACQWDQLKDSSSLDLMPHVIAAIQTDAPTEYHLQRDANGYQAANAKHGFQVFFQENNVHLRPTVLSPSSPSLNFELVGYGYGDEIVPVDEPSLVGTANRMEYQRGSVTEWYLNGELGLEQGFTIDKRPARAAQHQPLVMVLRCSGAVEGKVNSQQTAVDFTVSDGGPELSYGFLYANDATGRALTITPDIRKFEDALELRLLIDDEAASYPIIIDPLIQNQDVKITASDGATGNAFGYSVAVDGDTAVIGAYHVGTNAGAAYIFVRNGLTWIQQAKLFPSDWVSGSGREFGSGVAIQGDWAVIGEPGYSSGKGAAYIFNRVSSTWSQQAVLLANDGATNDRFGRVVALDGSTALIGSHHANSTKGAAYVFVRSETLWSQQAKLTGSLSAADDGFGWGVSLSQNTALVGSLKNNSGAGDAYFFVRSGSSWSQQARLTGSSGQNFGSAVSVLGDMALIGAPRLNSGIGSAYIYTRSGTVWTQQATLAASDGSSSNYFGSSVWLSTGSAVIGASGKEAAYIFSQTSVPSVWVEKAKLTASDGVVGDSFGQSVCLSNNTVFVGAPTKNSSTGAAYIFEVRPSASPNTGGDSSTLSWAGEALQGGALAIRTGEKVQAFTDIDVNTPMGSMTFTRTYRQNKRSTFQFMGLGWTHNHALTLTKIIGTPNKLVIQLENGGELNLSETSAGSNQYVADVGSDATAVWNSGTSQYTLTASDKSTYVFDSAGKLLSHNWPNGEIWTYTYTSGKLTNIGDGYGRGLQFSYISAGGQFNDGQLWRVGDHLAAGLSTGSPSGRYVEFTYTTQKNNGTPVASPKALLANVLDLMGNTWTHKYYGQLAGQSDANQLDFLLETVSPSVDTTGSGTMSSITVEKLTYQTSGSTITNITRELGDSSLTSTYAFQPSGQNITNETTGGLTTVHRFKNGVYEGTEDPAKNYASQALNFQYRPEVIHDANGNSTQIDWVPDGKLLTKVTDALGNQTTFSYNTSGASADTLNYSINPLGRKTQFTYGDVNQPRLPTRVQMYDKEGGSLIYWQEWTYDNRGRVLTEKLFDPSGAALQRQIDRMYYSTGNGNGLLQSVTVKDLLNAANNQATTYYYDGIGRAIKVQQSSLFGSCKLSFAVYDKMNRVVAGLCNYENGGADPTTTAEAIALFNEAFPDKNRVTTSEFDAIGRQIKTVTNAGASYARTTLAVYDSLGRVVRTIRNYVANAAITDPYVHNVADFLHGENNDQNLLEQMSYNERGMLRKRTDVMGRVTLYGYDNAGRLIRTVTSASVPNYNNSYSTGGDPTLGSYVQMIASTAPDQDIVASVEYDAAGNVIKVTDSIGNSTLTAYDGLNRPIKVIRSASQPNYDRRIDPTFKNYVPVTDGDKDIVQVIEYDAVGRVRRTQDMFGNWTLYSYDAIDRPIRTVRNASRPGYDTALDPLLTNYVESTAADQDLITKIAYDPAGRMLYSIDEVGRRDWVSYDGLWRVVKRIDNAIGSASDGGVNDPRSASYQANLGLSDQDQISYLEYDTDGRISRTRDALGNWMLYGYDAVNRPVKTIRNASNFNYVFSVDPTLSRYVGAVGATSDQDIVTATQYDAQGRAAIVTNALGQETRFTYDALNRTLKTIGYFRKGVFDPAFPDRDLVSTTRYALDGSILATVDVRGTETAMTYDRAGRVLTVTRAANTSLAVTAYTCYDKAGRILRTIQNWKTDSSQASPDARDSQGNWLFAPSTHGAANDENLITTFTLDHMGRSITVSNPAGNTVTMTYDKDGQLESSTDPMSVVTKLRYDRLRRQILTVRNYQANGEDPAFWKWNSSAWTKSDGTTAIAFGTANDQNIIVLTEFDKSGRRIAMRDPRGNRTTYGYDALNRPTSLIDPRGSVWATAYLNQPDGTTRLLLTDPNSWVTQTNVNRIGQPASVQYLNESPKNTPDIFFSYDRLGNRLNMVEMDGSTTIRKTDFAYDQANRLTKTVFDRSGDGSDVQTVNYEYDAGGLRTKLTLPGNLSVVYVYDSRGRLLSLTDWSSQTTQYTYDGADRRKTQTVSTLVSSYSYDTVGRLSLLKHTSGSRTLGHFGYTINARGDRTSAYEALPRSTTGATTYSYNDASIHYYQGTWTDANPFKSSTSTNAALRMAFLSDQVTLTMGKGPDHGIYEIWVDGAFNQSVDGYAASATEQAINLTLSDEGPHILEVRNTGTKNAASSGFVVRYKALATPVTARQYDVQTINYGYDGIARVATANQYPGINTTAAAARAYGYSYDVANNRTQQVVTIGGTTTTNYSYDAANRLISDGTNTYTYDNAGRMTSDGINTHMWDRANRLLSMGGVSHLYNGLGQRVQQTVGANVTKYVLDTGCSLWKVLAETTGANTTRYLYDPKGLLAQQQPNVSWNFTIEDGLGSIRGFLNSSLSPLESRQYSPYGEPVQLSGSAQSSYGFAGEATDSNGLMYLRARHYRPSLGAFFSLDPVEDLNRYVYGGANPVNRIDPSGRIVTPRMIDVNEGYALAPTPVVRPPSPNPRPAVTPIASPTPSPTPLSPNPALPVPGPQIEGRTQDQPIPTTPMQPLPGKSGDGFQLKNSPKIPDTKKQDCQSLYSFVVINCPPVISWPLPGNQQLIPGWPLPGNQQLIPGWPLPGNQQPIPGWPLPGNQQPIPGWPLPGNQQPIPVLPNFQTLNGWETVSECEDACDEAMYEALEACWDGCRGLTGYDNIRCRAECTDGYSRVVIQCKERCIEEFND